MKLKRFVAPDTNKAMRLIKEAFGPDAVILSSHTVDDGVEVVAAIDYDESVINQRLAQEVAEPVLDKRLFESGFSAPKNGLDEVKDELHLLRELLEHQLSGFAWQAKASQSPLHVVLIKRLMRLGFDMTSAESLVDELPMQIEQHQAWQMVLENLLKKLNCPKIDTVSEGGIYALLGPTGVGKTTTIAKLAARFSLKYGADQLGLITMDSYRIGAHEQLMTYGKILGVNVFVADDEASLQRSLRQLKDKKLVLIDTAGMNPRDSRVEELMALLQLSLFPIATALVLPATNQQSVLEDIFRSFNRYSIDGCIISKLDEALNIGSVLSVLMSHPKPLFYFTTGQRVPEDILLASPKAIIEKIVNSQELFNQALQTNAASQIKKGRTLYAE